MRITQTPTRLRRCGRGTSDARYGSPPARSAPASTAASTAASADPREPAAALANERPSPMRNGYRAWLDGLVRAASGLRDG